jgi:hypothetical protein
MIGVDDIPFLFLLILLGKLVMNEIAAIAEAAKSFFRKRKAVLGLIDSIAISIYF